MIQTHIILALVDDKGKVLAAINTANYENGAALFDVIRKSLTLQGIPSIPCNLMKIDKA